LLLPKFELDEKDEEEEASFSAGVGYAFVF
jgi:hypothetical protein